MSNVGNPRKHLSLFAGIDGFGLAFDDAGIETVAVSEVDRFACRVLEHRRPRATNFGDIRLIGGKEVEERFGRVDVISAGFPCQDLSVAGRREGLGGSRSSLFWEAARLAGELQPAWFVLENVPGLLYSNKGRDFALVLDALCELGYGVAWRVLDAQSFGVPQRRRRVFIVGHLGDPFGAAEVLFEPGGVPDQLAPGCETGKDIAAPRIAGSGECGGNAGRRREDEVTRVARVVPFDTTQITSGENRSNPKPGDPCHPLAAGAHPPVIAYPIQDGREREKVQNGLGIGGEGEPAYTVDTTGGGAVAFALRGREGGAHVEISGDRVSTLRGSSGGSSRDYVVVRDVVRRLMPVECEKLQGFLPGYTDIPGASDSARHRVLGNAIAVPVGRWIGKRIQAAEEAT